MIRTFMFFVVLVGVGVNAAAVQYNSVTIDHISMVDTGIARVGGSTSTPKLYSTDCANTRDAATAQFVFDATTPVGKSWFALLTAALVSGKKVHLLGGGSCETWEANTSYEKLRNVYLLN